MGPYMKTLGDRYKLGVYQKFQGLGHHRWTLDEERGYALLTRVYDALCQPNEIFHTQKILNLLDAHADILSLNDGLLETKGT